MGIVGEHPPEEVIRRLQAQADVYRRLDPDRPALAAIHLVYAVAQAQPGADGRYLLRMDDALVRRWVDLTRARPAAVPRHPGGAQYG
ncbi:MAG: hypothetical protein U0531_14410 [Dehalococcoidia bacterium]